jgi:hypothetical protein
MLAAVSWRAPAGAVQRVRTLVQWWRPGDSLSIRTRIACIGIALPAQAELPIQTVNLKRAFDSTAQ